MLHFNLRSVIITRGRIYYPLVAICTLSISTFMEVGIIFKQKVTKKDLMEDIDNLCDRLRDIRVNAVIGMYNLAATLVDVEDDTIIEGILAAFRNCYISFRATVIDEANINDPLVDSILDTAVELDSHFEGIHAVSTLKSFFDVYSKITDPNFTEQSV